MTLQDTTRPSDVFVGLHIDFMWHMETKEVTNGGGSAIVLEPGYPMNGNTPLLVAAIANMNGLNFRREVIQAGETKKVLVLMRGPATIIKDGLPTEDYSGAAFNMSTFVSEIAGIPDILVRTEPPEQVTLTADDPD